MGRVELLLAIHIHQPVGNFHDVFKKAVEECYEPFIEEFAAADGLRFNLHVSGPLLEWILDNRPRLMDTLAGLVSEDRLEMMGGGFYEPLLATIPTKDVLGQVRMMEEFLKEHLGAGAKGIWLTERVWAPSIPMRLEGTGCRYTVVDDTHFLYAGLAPEDLLDYYMTESLGSPLAVFPGLKKLRYLIPFRPVEEVIEFLGSVRPQSGSVGVTYGDDGEKFGLWPGTFDWVHKKGWLKRFLAGLAENRDWLETGTFSRFLGSHTARGRAYFPTSSYEEMLTWALPVEAAARLEELFARFDVDESLKPYRNFIRGGLWENFLVRYPEANFMHKRMLQVSKKIGDGTAGQRELYRAQCNCAYWHGLFGGLYLNHLRAAVWANIIDAQQAAGQAAKGPFVEVLDIDLDGREELFMGDESLWITVAPHSRGAALDLCLVDAKFNAVNVFSRHREAYHKKLRDAAAKKAAEHPEDGTPSIHDIVRAKEADLDKLLVYDSGPRHLFMDRLFPELPTVDALMGSDFEERGEQPAYDILGTKIDGEPPAASAVLTWQAGGLKLTKGYRITRGFLDVAYRISGQRDEAMVFGVEHNLNVLSATDPEKYYTVAGDEEGRSLGEAAEYDNAGGFTLVNNRDGFTIRLESSVKAGLVHYPVETVSNSEEGFERNYQGSCFVLLYEIAPGSEDVSIAQRLSVQMHG